MFRMFQKLIQSFRLELIVTCFLILTVYASGSLAAGNKATEAQLTELKSEIEKLNQWLAKASANESDLVKKLKQLELGISRSTQEANRLKARIEELESSQLALAGQKVELQVIIDSQKEDISTLIEASYKTGKKNRLKLLLDQGDSLHWMRMLTYYQNISQVQLSQLESYQKNIDQMDRISTELHSSIGQSRIASIKLAKERQLLQQQKNTRVQVLANLRTEIKSMGQKLETKKADRARLETLLAKVVEAIVDLVPGELSRPFSTQKGKISWPAENFRLSQTYGSKIGNGPLRSQGVVLRVRDQSNIKAVHHGRIVFADWLNGYGLLMIIDHGEGYMSLYARNEVLLRSVGEWINTGETVAQSGDSGLDDPGVYFEIRYKGKPQDPLGWLAKR